ncbi:MAG: DNA-processing protein DprA [Chitinophagales bacterium]|nr:DNA-processing protein DprA [Chitinophagales bacterium]
MEEKLYQIALTLIPQVGPITARNLISYCGGARAVFENRKKALLKIPGIGEQMCEYILNKQVLAVAEKELQYVQENGISVLSYLDADYPSRLKPFPDSPSLLYYKGKASLNAQRHIAIVGTRKPTPQGIRLCEDLVADLKPYGVTIISGLAYGIDVTAHKNCLVEGIPTIGVLGHGLKEIYPPQHKKVAMEMIEKGGLLTEYPSDMRPDREHFPMRNRIVAALCDALVVVETQRKGGSMITADLANTYNKDVFAYPGRIKDKTSEGCNLLIKSHKAALIESASDLSYIMRWDLLDAKRKVQQQLFIELDEREKLIVALLEKEESASIDQLTSKANISGSVMAAILLELEFKGVIKPLPGNRYVRI